MNKLFENLWICIGIMLFGVLIAGFSQIILKKASGKEYKSLIRQYLNFRVIFSYGLFALSTVCSLIAYRVLPLSMGPVWTAAAQIFVVVLGYFMLGERPNKRKIWGLILITFGIIIFCF